MVDAGLTFKEHAEAMFEAMEKSHTWLCRHQYKVKTHHLRLVYMAYAQSKLTHAMGAWWPSMNQGARAKLEVKHRRIAATIGGCVGQTRNGVKMREAGLEELQRKSRVEAGALYDRMRRLRGGAGARR
jgi:hypothetical protein